MLGAQPQRTEWKGTCHVLWEQRGGKRGRETTLSSMSPLGAPLTSQRNWSLCRVLKDEMDVVKQKQDRSETERGF